MDVIDGAKIATIAPKQIGRIDTISPQGIISSSISFPNSCDLPFTFQLITKPKIQGIFAFKVYDVEGKEINYRDIDFFYNETGVTIQKVRWCDRGKREILEILSGIIDEFHYMNRIEDAHEKKPEQEPAVEVEVEWARAWAAEALKAVEIIRTPMLADLCINLAEGQAVISPTKGTVEFCDTGDKHIPARPAVRGSGGRGVPQVQGGARCPDKS